MSVLARILTGAAGLAAVAGFASPAAAQYYPGYGNSGGGVVGAIISTVIGGGYGNSGYSSYGYGNSGYGGYGTNDRSAVEQCSRAVEARLGGGYGGGYGYNGGGRVVGITSVERKNSGIRVHGVAASGASGGYGNYGGGYGGGNLTFSCKADYRGGISSLSFDRADYGYNGYGGYNRGY